MRLSGSGGGLIHRDWWSHQSERRPPSGPNPARPRAVLAGFCLRALSVICFPRGVKGVGQIKSSLTPSQAVRGEERDRSPRPPSDGPFPADDDHRPYDHRQQRRSNLQIRFRHASGASYELPLGHVSTVTLGHAKTSLKFSSAFTCAERTLVAPDECCGSYPGSRVACGPTSELCTADGSSCE